MLDEKIDDATRDDCAINLSEFKDLIRMGIELNENSIGYAALPFIKNETTELGIAIAKNELWGKWVGFNSAIRLIENASKKLGITTFNAKTHETNIRFKKCD